MAVEDVFSIKGRGTVATGRIERGVIKINEDVEIVGFGETRKTVVTGVEMFRKLLDQGQAGDNVGCLLRGIEKDEVERGQVLAKPGTITPHKKFQGEVYVLKKEEGGRHTPFFTNYRPQFYVRTTDVTGTVELPEGILPPEDAGESRQAQPDDSGDEDHPDDSEAVRAARRARRRSKKDLIRKTNEEKDVRLQAIQRELPCKCILIDFFEKAATEAARTWQQNLGLSIVQQVMAAVPTVFACKNCGHQTVRGQTCGRCGRKLVES
jgi:hypothetical protein